MQVHPIKPKLKLPGTKRLKLKCVKIAFKINLHPYNEGLVPSLRLLLDDLDKKAKVGRCMLTLPKPR